MGVGVREDYHLDLSRPEHCYFLGAVLGDGTVARERVDIHIGRRIFSDKWINPAEILRTYVETGHNMRETARRTGHCRATIKRKLKGTEIGALWIQGSKGQTHLVVNESERLHGHVASTVAACKGNSAKVDDFLAQAIQAELKNWEK